MKNTKAFQQHKNEAQKWIKEVVIENFFADDAATAAAARKTSELESLVLALLERSVIALAEARNKSQKREEFRSVRENQKIYLHLTPSKMLLTLKNSRTTLENLRETATNVLKTIKKSDEYSSVNCATEVCRTSRSQALEALQHAYTRLEQLDPSQQTVNDAELMV